MKKYFFLMLLLLLPTAISTNGEMKLLAVSSSENVTKGGTADLFLEITPGTGRVFIDSFPLSKLDTQISTRFAKEVACNYIDKDCSNLDFFYTIRSSSSIVGGPSAGAAITILTISVIEDLPLNEKSAITGTINSGGIIGPVGGIQEKIVGAKENGLNLVLIPKYSGINETNLSVLRNDLSIEIVEVSSIDDALYHMTGFSLQKEYDVTIDEDYINTMNSVSISLCERAEEFSKRNVEGNTTGRRFLKKGLDAIEREAYYSAASYCFGSALNFNYEEMLKNRMSEEDIRLKVMLTLDLIDDERQKIKKEKLETLTDLEAYMVVNDRLSESENRLNNALDFLGKNDTNISVYELAYGIERLNSAQSWSVFFDIPGEEYNLDRDSLQESCIKKISEVEERIQYLQYYLPTGGEDAKETIKEAYNDYNLGEPQNCLYKSSIAKAKIDLVLNSMSIRNSDVEEVIRDRSEIVKNIIAKQSSKGHFPILAYSYYEYANSLKESDEYSALLYLEYALELGNLDIYFEREKIKIQAPGESGSVLFFTLGLGTGIIMTVMAFLIVRRKR